MIRTFSTTLAILASAAATLACCMVPKSYEGRIGQRRQQALLVWADGREELVLGIDYLITPKTKEGTQGAPAALPPSFAWIITVPAEPDAYAVADRELFQQMNVLAGTLLAPKTHSREAAPAGTITSQPLEFGTRVQVGPYDIQPVRARGVEALGALNQWLDANGFPGEDRDHMAYFVTNRFTFLCVKVLPGEGEKAVGAGGRIPPLHLSFASERPYYPLKFSSRQGVFDVDLHVLTRTPLDYTASAPVLERLNWRNKDYERNVSLGADSQPALLRKVLEASRLTGDRDRWRYNALYCADVNSGDSIATWTEDVFLETAR